VAPYQFIALSLIKRTGNKTKDPIMAIIIDKEVKIPKNIVGLKFEVAKTKKPNTMVEEV
jgi:hypothetical protein|tara:strand:- start:4 stop:180 length:177 start_codon:yes stop_codon:yes gene_type:complete